MLRDLGLAIDNKNDKFCEIDMGTREKWKTMLDKEVYGELEMKKQKKKRLREIETLKKDMLPDKVSLYDYLRMSPDQALVYAKNENIGKSSMLMNREIFTRSTGISFQQFIGRA